MEPTGWADMFSVLLVAIAGHMSFKDICIASTVCGNWRNVFGSIEWKQPLKFTVNHHNMDHLIDFFKCHKNQLQNVIIEYAPGQPKGTWESYKNVFAALAGAANLHTLTLMTERNSRQLPHDLQMFTKENWPALKHLTIYNPTSSDMKQFCQNMAPQLVSLKMSSVLNLTWCTEIPWELLEKLELPYCWRAIVPQILQTPFDSLKHLSIKGCGIDDRELKLIVRWIQFVELETLDLSSNFITDAGIADMCNLLNKDITPIDSDKNPWREVSNGWVEKLVELDLSFNKLTRHSLTHLKKITHPHFSGLTKFNIIGIFISKEVVDDLCECEFAGQLTELVIRKWQISEKNLDRLRAKLPNCEIEFA